MVLLQGFLKFPCWGVFMRLLGGHKTCFYTLNEDLVILCIKRRWVHSVDFVRYVFCLLYYCFCLLFSEDLTALRKYTNYKVKIYCWWYFLAASLWICDLAVTFATLSFKVSGNFYVLVFAIVFSIVSFSMVCYLGFFVIFSAPWLFDSILCAFS